jgi:Sec-independent protein translocase protein TatA
VFGTSVSELVIIAVIVVMVVGGGAAWLGAWRR